MANPSLDDILKEIERDSMSDAAAIGSLVNDEPRSAGMSDVTVHEQPPKVSSPSPMAEDFRADSIPQITRQFLGGGSVMSEQSSSPGQPAGLSPRQKALPKLSYRMLGSLAAMFILVVGLGSAVMLSQTPQDIRQYAYDPNAKVDPALEPYLNKQAASDDEIEAPADTAADELASDPSTDKQAVDVQMPVQPAPWWQDPLLIAGAAVIISGILILAVFLHWLFAV